MYWAYWNFRSLCDLGIGHTHGFPKSGCRVCGLFGHLIAICQRIGICFRLRWILVFGVLYSWIYGGCGWLHRVWQLGNLLANKGACGQCVCGVWWWVCFCAFSSLLVCLLFCFRQCQCGFLLCVCRSCGGSNIFGVHMLLWVVFFGWCSKDGCLMCLFMRSILLRLFVSICVLVG